MKDNPYQTPGSDLITDKVQMPKTIWWKVYFAFSLIIYTLLLTLLVFIGDEMPVSLFDAFDFFVGLIGVFGIFGIAFNKRIGSAAIWKYFFYFFLALSIVSTVIFPLLGIEQFGEVSEFDITLFIGIIDISVTLWGLYLYGFKRPQIWSRT